MANILFWGPKMDDPRKEGGAQKSEKETSDCFESVINQLKIFKTYQMTLLLWTLFFVWLTYCLGSPKWMTPKKEGGGPKVKKNKTKQNKNFWLF